MCAHADTKFCRQFRGHLLPDLDNSESNSIQIMMSTIKFSLFGSVPKILFSEVHLSFDSMKQPT